jgi:hypothetical protein
MSTIIGQIQAVSQRGKATNIQVNGQWFGCGFNGVPAKQGDFVQFEAVQNGQYLNADMGSFQVTGGGQAQQAPRAQGQGGGYQQRKPYGGGAQRQAPAQAAASKDDYWTKKEERDVITQQVIQLQASRNAAIAVCSAALAQGILPLPAKKADAFDTFLAAIDEATQRYEASSAAKRDGNDPFSDASGVVNADDDNNYGGTDYA